MKPLQIPILSTILLVIAFGGMGQKPEKISPSEVAALTTDDEVQAFIKRHGNEYVRSLKLNTDLDFSSFGNEKDKAECSKAFRTLGAKVWERLDFDGNGKTDLLLYLRNDDPRIALILDRGMGKYETIVVTDKPFQPCTVAKIESAKKFPIIRLFGSDYPSDGTPLFYKENRLIEFNSVPANLDIESIELATNGCFGTCPIFSLRVDSTLKGSLVPKGFNDILGVKDDGKTYTCRISAERWKKLSEVLNYIDFSHLKDKYAVPWTDDAGATLKIKFSGGKIKEIADYGMRGTNGLALFYQLLDSIRRESQWSHDK